MSNFTTNIEFFNFFFFKFIIDFIIIINFLFQVFWLKIAKNGVYCCYRYCSKLFGKMRRETVQEKVQCIRGERKLNFDNEITEILVVPVLPSLPVKCPKCMLGGCSKWKPIVAMALLKIGEKKNLWQLSCYKWRGKKKRCYIHNIFHNKLQVVSCYLFKFEPNTKITFFAPIITISNNFPLRICYKKVMKILWTYHF